MARVATTLMSTRAVLLVGLLAACERPTPTATPTPSPSATPSPSPSPTPTPTPSPSPSPTPDPAPVEAGYPEARILDARIAIDRSCAGLVYKRKCSELRKGSIELGVTIDESGAQTKVDVLSNDVAPDGKLVLECTKKALATHRFEPHPGGATFTIKFRLADRC